ncbi:hypothetical protein AA313_de0207426 [Arthrobotrys entomopaga]|nr:hypothetical protein AA313_de0207426 [Arthrobotrys entomopaga]
MKDLNLNSQDHRSYLNKLDRFFRYTANKKIRTDVGWCSQTLQGPKKRLRRSQCHGGRDLPFIRILPLADTGSVRNKLCIGCKKGPEEIGWYCDGCLKDVLCDICGDFVCDVCDPKRTNLIKCSDCPTRRCESCFLDNGGTYCQNSSCDERATCGMHKFEVSCDTCCKKKEISCSSCSPASKCKGCNAWIYSDCKDSKPSFHCNCDFELCHKCCETAKTKFLTTDIPADSFEELVYGIDSTECPIIPRAYDPAEHDDTYFLDNNNWCCFYCKIMPRRGERFSGKRGGERTVHRRRSSR